MNQIDNIKKVGADKIVLLGLFVLALVLANLVVSVKTTVKLSGPIKLEHAGLAVSLPTGPGWQVQDQWSYGQNCYTLTSIRASGIGSIAALINCRYLLADSKANPDEWFQEHAIEAGAEITEKGKLHTAQNNGEIVFDWAHLTNPKEGLDFFIATAELPLGRALEVEVRQLTDDVELAQKTFRKILNTLRLEDYPLLEAGAEIVTQIKKIGLYSLLDEPADYYLIENQEKQKIGFIIQFASTYSAAAPGDQADNYPIRAGGCHYLHQRLGIEQIWLFKGDDNLSSFILKSETADTSGRRGVLLTLDEDGVMTVKKSAAGIPDLKYTPGPAAIPAFLLETVLEQLIESELEKILIDIIGSDGKILPAQITKVTPAAMLAGDKSQALRVKLLDGRNFSRQIYFDDQYKVSTQLLDYETTYMLERTTAEQLLTHFPERADIILRKKEILQQN